jgi:TRAP-type C4-dicarboxylate transport system permease small subunit
MKYALWVLNNIEEIVGGGLYLMIVSIVSIQVFLRYVLGSPVAWSDEIAVTSFVWVVFLGASAAMKRKMHIGVDVITNLAPRRVQEILAILINLILLWLLYRFVTEGWAFSMLATTSKVTPILRVPYGYVDLAVPVGSALMMVRVTQATIQQIKKLRSTEGPSAPLVEVEEVALQAASRSGGRLWIQSPFQ